MKPTQHLTVKDWAKEDRPREKMLTAGPKQLTNAELLAILIGSGVSGSNAVELGKALLSNADNNLTRLSRIDIAKLQAFKGIGEAKAVKILAALELGYRMIGENIDTKTEVITTSEDLYNLIAPKIINLPHEEFWVVYLNPKHKVLGVQKISQGGITSTAVDLRLIFKRALELSSTSIAVAHNHPSGAVQPSREDEQLTRRIADAGSALGIRLIDHLVVGARTESASSNAHPWYSFAEEGLI